MDARSRVSRRTTFAAAIGSVVCFIMGCGGPSETPPASTEEKTLTRGTIGYSALTLTNPFFQEIADSMRAEATEASYELLVVSAERDVRRQADQVDDFIVRGVSAIVLNPCDSQSIGPAIRKANEAGIPVFTNDIAYFGTEGKVISHVATDNLQGGRLAGEALVGMIGATGGKVAILHFPQAESCQQRVKGFLEVVTEHNDSVTASADRGGRIEIVATLDGGGMRDEGHDAARDALQANPDLAAIFAINDPSALGAYAALEAAGRADQVRIIGFDGQTSGKQAIRDGKIVCDPIQFPDRIGAKTIELMLQYFSGENVPEQVLIPSELYRQEDALADPTLD